MICDCVGDELCHGALLADAFTGTFSEVVAADEAKLDAYCAECVLDDFDEDNEDGAPEDLAHAPKFIPSLEQLNETVRSGAARLDQERPMWLDSWVRIIWIIRLAAVPVFLEMFSGKAGLTR